MTIDEVKNVFNMGLSNDIEIKKLAKSIIETEFPYWTTYEVFVANEIYSLFDNGMGLAWMTHYIIFLRNKYLPYIVYSGPKHIFI